MDVAVDQPRGQERPLRVEGLPRGWKAGAAEARDGPADDEHVRGKDRFVVHVHHAAVGDAQVRGGAARGHVNALFEALLVHGVSFHLSFRR